MKIQLSKKDINFISKVLKCEMLQENNILTESQKSYILELDNLYVVQQYLLQEDKEHEMVKQTSESLNPINKFLQALIMKLMELIPQFFKLRQGLKTIAAAESFIIEDLEFDRDRVVGSVKAMRKSTGTEFFGYASKAINYILSTISKIIGVPFHAVCKVIKSIFSMQLGLVAFSIGKKSFSAIAGLSKTVFAALVRAIQWLGKQLLRIKDDKDIEKAVGRTKYVAKSALSLTKRMADKVGSSKIKSKVTRMEKQLKYGTSTMG